MTRAAMGIVMVAALIGCGEEEAPSCPAAIGHYYDAGCFLYDASTTPARKLTENESILTCRELLIAVPDRCQPYFDDLMFCLDDQMAGSTEAQCMSCNTEIDALLGCD